MTQEEKINQIKVKLFNLVAETGEHEPFSKGIPVHNTNEQYVGLITIEDETFQSELKIYYNWKCDVIEIKVVYHDDNVDVAYEEIQERLNERLWKIFGYDMDIDYSEYTEDKS